MKRRDFFAGLGGAAAMPLIACAQSDVATRLAPAGELRAALIASNPVLVTRGGDGQLGGVSVEMARAFAVKLGVPVRLMPYENPARYNESLGKDAWDIGLAARDPSRGEYPAFSDVFMEVDNGYVARAGLSIKAADEVDRKDMKIAVAQGSAPVGFVTRTIKNAEIVRVPGGLGPAARFFQPGGPTCMARTSILRTALRQSCRAQLFLKAASISFRCRLQCQSRTSVLWRSSTSSWAMQSAKA